MSAREPSESPASPLPRGVEAALTVAAGALILGLTALTAADVILRYGFNAPVSGAFELTEVMLAALIFAALPLTTARDEHVTVDLVDAALGRRGRRAVRLIGDAVSAVVLALFAWRLGVQASRLAADGTTTFTLTVPLAPLAAFAALACALSAAVALARLVRRARD